MVVDQDILVLVCSTCGACELAIMDELRRLQAESGAPLVVQMEECLDTCESEPTFMVDGVSIAPATPTKLRSAVEMARSFRGSNNGSAT